MEREAAVRAAADILPRELRLALLARPVSEQGTWEEIRLRAGQGLSCGDSTGRERVIQSPEGRPLPVTQADLRLTVERATRASLQGAWEKLAAGFLPLPGGHRLGVCGTAALREGQLIAFRALSSLNIRVACPVLGVGEALLPELMEGGTFQSTLILAPPGEGKTTLLRDLIRLLGREGIRTGLADERGEVAALCQGVPQLDVGPLADVLDGCPKGEGMLLLLRSMAPQVLAADEITHPRDVAALCQGANCGTAILTTAHGSSLAELRRRKLYQPLLREQIFRRLVTISRTKGRRDYRVEVLQ